MMTDLDLFLKEKVKNRHITYPGLSTCYVRKGPYFIEQKRYDNVFQISSVSATEPGNFSALRLLDEIEQKWDGIIFVENVLDQRIGRFLKRRNYKEKKCPNGGPSCFWKHSNG